MERKTIGGINSHTAPIWPLWRGFMMKAIMGALIISPIHPSGPFFQSLAWPFILLAGIGSLLAASIPIRKDKGYLFVLALLSFPAMAIIGFVLKLPIWSILLAAAFTVWFFMKETEELGHGEETGTGLVVWTVLIGAAVWFAAASFSLPFLYPVLFLVWVQFFLFSIGICLERFFGSGDGSGKVFFMLKTILVLLMLPLAASSAAVLVSGMLRSVLVHIRGFVAGHLANGMEPVMGVFTSFLYGNMDREMVGGDPGGAEGGYTGKENVLNLEGGDGGMGAGILVIIGILLLTIIGMYLAKRLNLSQRQYVAAEESIASAKVVPSSGTVSMSLDPHYSKAANQIRKTMSQFEGYARKKRLGREPYESMRDWTERIGLQPSDIWMETYENVRYGTHTNTTGDAEAFAAECKKLKVTLREASARITKG